MAQFKTAVLVFLGAEYARRGWVQQYHIGALRNNNLRQFKLLGPDVGFLKTIQDKARHRTRPLWAWLKLLWTGGSSSVRL